MLPFFRKIRWRLASENQLFKYSRYAVGEIVLVVVGILIALQINNWNEDRIRKENISTYMKKMIGDLNYDIRFLSIWGNANRFRYNSSQHLLVLSGQKPTKQGYSLDATEFVFPNLWNKPIPIDFDADFVNVAFIQTLISGNMNPNSFTIDELQNNGLFSHIKNDSLKASIFEYYAEYERRLGSVEDSNAKKYRDDWVDSLTENGYNAEEISDLKGALNWLKNDQVATARLKNLIFNAQWRYRSADVLIEEANKLIEMINRYELKDE